MTWPSTTATIRSMTSASARHIAAQRIETQQRVRRSNVILERISKCKENMYRACVNPIHIGIQIDAEIQPHGAERSLIPEAVSYGMAESRQAESRELRKNVPRVIKQSASHAGNRKEAQRKTVFQVSQRHHVSAARVGIVKTISPKSRGTTGKVSFGRRQSRLSCAAKRMVPTEPSRRHKHRRGSNRRIRIMFIEQRREIDFGSECARRHLKSRCGESAVSWICRVIPTILNK